jgi:hypothetical protein
MTTLIALTPATPFSPSRFFARLEELLPRPFNPKARRPWQTHHNLLIPPTVGCPHAVAWRSSLGR